MIRDVSFVCDNGIEEDVAHFLMVCREFGKDRHALVDEVRRIMGAGEWLDEFGNVGKEEKMALVLGKGVEGVSKDCWRKRWVNICIVNESGGKEGRIYCMVRL